MASSPYPQVSCHRSSCYSLRGGVRTDGSCGGESPVALTTLKSMCLLLLLLCVVVCSYNLQPATG